MQRLCRSINKYGQCHSNCRGKDPYSAPAPVLHKFIIFIILAAATAEALCIVPSFVAGLLDSRIPASICTTSRD
jgi:hypothetical protein